MISTTLARVNENLIAAGVSRAVLATIVGMKPSTLSAANNGIMNLGGPREAELLTASYRLLELRTACEPFALPSNANMVKLLVERLQDGRLSTEKIREMVSRLFEQ